MSKRRPRGESDPYPIRDKKTGKIKRWAGVLDIGPAVDGKRPRRYLYGKTRADVATQLKHLRADREHGIDLTSERQTVSEYLDRWLVHIKTRLRSRSYESYECIVTTYLKPALGKHRLNRLRTEHIDALITRLQAERSLATSYIRKIHAVIRRALNQARKWGYVTENVATNVDVPKVDKRPVQVLTPEQARHLWSVVAQDRLAAFWLLLLTTGVRRGEGLASLWKDFDPEAATLAITGSLQRQEGKLVRSLPKTDAGIRTLALTSILVEALLEHQKQQAEERAIAPDWHDLGYMFTTRKGTPLEPRNIHHEFKDVLERAGLPSTIRLHDLRHSAITFLIAKGVHPRVAQQIAGHSTITVTMNTYGHVALDLQRPAAAEMDALLRSREPATEEEKG